MNDIMKIVQALEDSNILLNGVSKTIKKETKQKGGFSGMLLGTLGASLFGNMLAEKGIVKAFMEIKWTLMLPYPVTNFEIRRYYQNEPRFNGFYSRNNLP